MAISDRTKREIKVRYKGKKWASKPESELDSRFEISFVTLIERDATGKEVDREEVTVKGNADEGQLVTGLEYRMFGKWEERHPHGWSFSYDSFVIDKPATRDAVIFYLKQCKGFGSVRSGQLFDKFGESCIDVLMNNPQKVSREIRGLGLEDCEDAAKLLKTTEHIRKSKLELIGLLTGKHFPKKIIDDLIRDYGAEAAEFVRRNPYLLMRYRNCGFQKTDKLYLEFGYDPARLKRQAFCAWHAVAAVSDGDTWFPRTAAVQAIRKNIAGTNTRVDRAIELATKTEMLATRTADMGVKWIAEGKKAAQEAKVARLIVEAMAEYRDNPELCMWPDVESLNVYPHQREELSKSLHGFICVLAGSPGTGKTHSTAEVLNQIINQHGLDHVAACAPTGKAAVRMSEAFEKSNVPLRAITIHSMLGVLSAGDGWSFEHNEHNPHPAKFIVADEESMTDVALFGSLLAARNKGTHILLIGDTNQLSPVGHGAPLRDSIAAGVPTGTLTEIQRTSGRIVQACAEIRDHKRFTPSEALDLEAGENLVVIESQEPERQIEYMQSVVEKLKGSGNYDPVWDVQILCAVNKKTSPLHRAALNKILQNQLNNHGATVNGNPFRVGDKVICLKNGSYESAVKSKVVRGRWVDSTPTQRKRDEDIDRDPFRITHDEFSPPGRWIPQIERVWQSDPHGPETTVETLGKQYVANGEQGEVLAVEAGKFVVRLFNPDREVIVLRSNKKNDDDDSGDSGNGNGGSDVAAEESSSGSGCNWDLGYAISVHKSQGSEWPVVLVMLDDSGAARQVCSRNWLYTAISRAKTMCLMIGQLTTALQMCRRDGLQRKTFLKELILEGMQEAGIDWPQVIDARRLTENEKRREEQPFAWTDEIISGILEGVI